MTSDIFFFLVQLMGSPVDGFGGVQLEDQIVVTLLGHYLGHHILQQKFILVLLAGGGQVV